jgi:hypothetical protein
MLSQAIEAPTRARAFNLVGRSETPSRVVRICLFLSCACPRPWSTSGTGADYQPKEIRVTSMAEKSSFLPQQESLTQERAGTR